MARDIERDALPTWSAHTLVMTLLEGPDHFNGHCTCDRWSYRTADWADLGMKWAWHYIAESEGTRRPPLRPPDRAGRARAQRRLRRGLSPAAVTPSCKGRTLLPRLRAGRRRGRGRPRRQLRAELLLGGHRRPAGHARDAAHQRVACRNCGNCLDCDDDASPDHQDCICPLGQALPVEVTA